MLLYLLNSFLGYRILLIWLKKLLRAIGISKTAFILDKRLVLIEIQLFDKYMRVGAFFWWGLNTFDMKYGFI